jgi:hypothetical protein
MSNSFKFSEKKRKGHNSITLDRKHKEVINKFSSLEKSLPNKEINLFTLQEEYKILCKSANRSITDKDIEKKFEIRDKIIALEKEIDEIKNGTDKIEYYLDTLDLISKYYNKVSINEKKKKGKKAKKTLNFFNCAKKDNQNMTKFVNKTNKFNRSDLLDEYLSIIDENYSGKYEYNENESYCYKCDCEKTLIHAEALYVCQKCGEATFTVIDSERPSYKEPPSEISYFAYKRINHFNEWISQFQAKESTNIPQDVYDQILCEIKKERIKDMSKLNHVKMRQILKRLNLNKYYEHIHHIINKLNGLPPPVLSRELEERMRLMFKEIQKPFSECCPKNRKNFLSYSYVIRKFLELLGEDEYIPYFPLLKSREKLYQQDVIWKGITKMLKWEFYPSL